jgi:hypothetical protein
MQMRAMMRTHDSMHASPFLSVDSPFLLVGNPVDVKTLHFGRSNIAGVSLPLKIDAIWRHQNPMMRLADFPLVESLQSLVE